ncbi:MAG: response regulator [Myxococcales bacterium]|nr:response regulator [Myxococcales bacterium]
MEAIREQPPSPQRLLLVDDEENILKSLRRVLRGEHWEIATAPDAEKGLQLLEDFSPQVVMSDFRMPGLNGVEFLSRVKERSPRAQRIMLTGQADQHAIEEAINRSEIFRFVSKPWNDAQLVLTVRSAFEQHRLVVENEGLCQLIQRQNAELKALNADLEERVAQRTRQLERAKREWERTFDTIDYPLALLSTADCKLKRANLAYARAAGRPIRDLAFGPRCHEFLFGDCQPCLGCPLSNGWRVGETGKAEIVRGGRVFTLVVYPMEESLAVCSYRDVTEERLMTRRLIEAEKMVAVGGLAGGVAHEINNPLGGILAFAQLMKRDEGRTASDLESLGLIEESALRCRRIVESLLQFSRRSRDGEMRPIDLGKCVEDAVLLFRAQLKGLPRAELKLELSPGLPKIKADPGRLGQVLLNLLQNALQALSHEEGEIRVVTGSRDGRCFFRVSDTGSGIAPEHLPHIFEPHFTTKPLGEGTGLGLSIAYGIAKDHAGEIEVETEVGKGSAFTVSIPSL